MKTIAFFSSDARYLYQADVFRVLALPKGTVIQFRYQEKWVHPDVLKIAQNKFATIFYATGNKSDFPQGKKQIYSVRVAKIVDFTKSAGTGLMLFYLQLSDFVNYKIVNTPEEKLPTKDIFVSEVEVAGEVERWDQVVERVKDSFDATLFFNIISLSDVSQNVIEPNFNPITKQAMYELPDDKELILDICYYDTSKGKNLLKINDNRQLITINAESPIFPGAIKDDRKIPLETKSIDVPKQTTILSFVTEVTGNNDPEKRFDINLPLNVKRGIWKPFLYALYSIMGFGALAITTHAGSIAKNSGEFVWAVGDFALAAILAGVASSQLYRLFNKK